MYNNAYTALQIICYEYLIFPAFGLLMLTYHLTKIIFFPLSFGLYAGAEHSI